MKVTTARIKMAGAQPVAKLQGAKGALHPRYHPEGVTLWGGSD